METLDLKKSLKYLYSPSAKEVGEVQVPGMNFLMIDGRGDPNTSTAYQQAIEALYSLSYTLKFALKKAGTADYTVMPLEGLWWADDMTAFAAGDREAWYWTAMIMQPEPVTDEAFAEAREEAGRKKDLPALTEVRFERFDEGRAAQIMHIGPYSEEGPTIARIHRFIEQQGSKPRGKHHEIYLGDPRRTAPERLKTVIRQPF